MLKQLNELKAGIILNYVLIVINALVGLLYTPYMLRTMGQSEYGLYSLVASIISYLTILDLGFGNAIIRYTAKFRTQGKDKELFEMLGMFFVLYVGISLLSVFIGFILYLNIDDFFGATMTTSELLKARVMMILLIFNLAFTFPLSIYSSVNTAYERFVFPRILNIARIVLNTAVMIVLLHMGYRAIAMVVVQTIFNLLTLILNYLYGRYELKVKLLFSHFDWGLLKEISIYSMWIFIAAIVDRIDLSTGQFVLGAVSGTSEVAIFAIAMTLRGMYVQFSTAISSVFLPKMTEMVTLSHSDEEISNLFIRTGRLQYIVLSFILVGYIIFGRDFMVLWAGDEYKVSYYIALILFIPDTIPLCQNMGISIMQARNQIKFRSLSYLIVSIFSLVLQILLGKYFGGVGCAIAIAFCVVVGRIIVMDLYYQKVQKLDIRAFWVNIGKMSIVPMLSCAVFLTYIGFMSPTVSWSTFFLNVSIFSIIYVLLAVLFQFNKEERLLVRNIVSKIIPFQ